MRTPLVKSMRAASAIDPYRIVKFGATAGTVAAASAPADPLLGVFGGGKPLAAGELADIVLADIAEVAFGGTVAAGAFVTADANGRAVAAGAGEQAIGRALADAAAGEIAPVLIGFATA